MAGYENSGETRATCCAAPGLPVATLHYCRRRLGRIESRLVEIDLRETGTGAGAARWAEAAATNPGAVALVLRNGRRVEIGWNDLDRVAGDSQPLRTLIHWLEEA